MMSSDVCQLDTSAHMSLQQVHLTETHNTQAQAKPIVLFDKVQRIQFRSQKPGDLSGAITYSGQ